MQRSFSDPTLSGHATRNIATQTDTPVRRTRSRQTQTEPELCFSCHAAQLAELLRPGRPGRIPARPGDFAGGDLYTIEEADEGLAAATCGATARAPVDAAPAQVLDASLRDPRGRALRHVMCDPDLLRLMLRLPAQSLAGRTAE